MSGRDLKVQLGARVPAEVRTQAQEAAKAQGLSLNLYIERLIREGSTPPVSKPIDGQITIDEVFVDDKVVTVVDQQVVKIHENPFKQPPGEDAIVAHAQPLPQSFDKNCRNGTYHWKHGPGRPCAYCKGEI